MEIIKAGIFEKRLEQLPKEIQRLYFLQENRFCENWRDSRLHIKKVASLPFVFSFRITRRYRGFFYFKNQETAVFFEIDLRKDIYR